MAAIAEKNMSVTEAAPTKKKGRPRKALKPKTASSSEANIVAGEIAVAAEAPEKSAGKENHDALSKKKKTKKGASKKGKQQVKEMQEQLEKLKIEADENLKAKDEPLKHKEEDQLQNLQKIEPTDALTIPPIPTTSGEGKPPARPVRNKKLPEKFKDFKMG